MMDTEEDVDQAPVVSPGDFLRLPFVEVDGQWRNIIDWVYSGVFIMIISSFFNNNNNIIQYKLSYGNHYFNDTLKI